MKEQSLEGVLDILDNTKDSPILFIVSQRFNSHLNLLLLRHLVKDKGLKGVYLIVDRPSDIMVRLLTVKRINPERVIFLDPISKVSGLASPHAMKQVKLMDNPFFSEVEQIMSDEGHDKLVKEGVSFIIVDNLSALSCYVDVETMSSLLKALSRWKDLTVFLCADDINTNVTAKAMTVCCKEVRFNEHMVPEVVRKR
jgi:hypothetical protein